MPCNSKQNAIPPQALQGTVCDTDKQQVEAVESNNEWQWLDDQLSEVRNDTFWFGRKQCRELEEFASNMNDDGKVFNIDTDLI